MDSKRIDWLAKLLARSADRRGALKTIAAGTIGGAALAQGKTSNAVAQDAPGEEWVLLYEELATAIAPVTGECAKVSDAIQQFQAQNADRIAQMQTETSSWGADQVAAHQKAHGARIQQASVALQLAITRCGYLPNSDSAVCLAESNAVLGEPGPAPGFEVTESTPVAHRTAAPASKVMAQITENCWSDPANPGAYCDCACTSDFTVGNCAAWFFACGFGGCAAGPSCCWFGICTGGFDHQTCENQCQNCQGIQVNC